MSARRSHSRKALIEREILQRPVHIIEELGGF